VGVLDRKLVRDLRRIRGQAAMIIVVIACAVATAVMSFGVLRSLAQTRAEYYERYHFADIFATLNRAPESVTEAIERIPGIARVQTRLAVDAALEVEGIDEPVVGRFLSLPERGEPAVNAIALRQGRTIGPGNADEIVVSENFASAHGLVPGARLRAMLGGHKRQFVIVGIALSPEYIYALGPGMIAPDDRRFGILWMGRQALEAALDLKGEFNEVGIQLDGSNSALEVIERLEAVLKPYGGAGAYTREHQSSHAFVSSMLDQLSGVGRVVPLIFLMVAAFLAHTVMGRLIDTQRQQIGLLKALGVGDRAIGWHYLKLALVLIVLGTGLGLAAGAGLGFGLTDIYTQFFHFPFLRYKQDPAISVAAGLVAAAALVVGTSRGVRRAVSLPPAVAMVPAVPSAYRTGSWERLGIHRRFSEPTRMILRHLARWPLRAVLAISGLSLAVALQISMLFSFDALDHMINGFYSRAQRQDLTVFFTDSPLSAAADEATSWPGVLKAEGYRTIPVRLSLGTRARLVNLTGLQSTATLVRLLDAKLAPVRLPSRGIALSSKLAALLHAETGDVVTVEAIGSNTRINVPVAQITEQYIGMDAYMDLDALNELVGGGSRISGVHLLIDKSRREALYRTLKSVPTIAGISERAAVLASFQDTMARTLTIIVSFFVAFAGLTAVSIVYSGARIILSEREREMATLMALGFTTREAGYVLVGEIAILVLLALPLGCVLGRGLAWVIAERLDTDLYRVPLIISSGTSGLAMLVVVLAAVISTWIVGRHLRRLDVLATLNPRE
jgi:putative ABC transport system permease protein